MRGRKLLVALVLAALVAAGAFMVSPLPPLAVTNESFDRIRVAGKHYRNSDAMSRAEVEAILGPPGDYRTGPTLRPLGVTGVWFVGPFKVLTWKGDTVIIHVYFDTAGQAVEKFRITDAPAEQDPLDHLLWRAKRQWRRWFPE